MEVQLRPASVEDLELLLAWRSHPALYAHFTEQKKPIEWAEHMNWWNNRRSREDWIICIREDNQWRGVGSVYVSSLDSAEPEIGLYVGEVTLWGRGVASKALALALDWARAQGYARAQAKILDTNAGSIRLFERAGFVLQGPLLKGTNAYRLVF